MRELACFYGVHYLHTVKSVTAVEPITNHHNVMLGDTHNSSEIFRSLLDMVLVDKL